jgi:hypothetical protein
MLFSMPRRNGGGWNGFKKIGLGDSPLAGSETLINHAPKRNYSFSFFIEEVFEEPWFIEGRRIRISLSIFAEFGDPITWFLRIDDREKISRIKKGSARIIQNP